MSSGIKYTPELLAAAAKSCHDIDEVIAFFGARPYKELRRHLVGRFARFGIDISHFARSERVRHLPRPTKNELSQAVSASLSLAEILRSLKRPDNARSRTLLRQWIADDGLSTAHLLGQRHQRGKPGTTPMKPPERILVKHEGNHRTKSMMLRRALREIGVPERCVECGTGPSWGGKPMTLEIDHIDGDWSDDRVENLRLLCPNCHAITRTWCRGGSRTRTDQ